MKPLQQKDKAMRDLIESILPRLFPSELDDEYGIVDVSLIGGSRSFDEERRFLVAEEVDLQTKFAKTYLDDGVDHQDAYLDLMEEIAERNDWRSTQLPLRRCSKLTFVNRIAALQYDDVPERGVGSPPLSAAA